MPRPMLFANLNCNFFAPRLKTTSQHGFSSITISNMKIMRTSWIVTWGKHFVQYIMIQCIDQGFAYLQLETKK